MSDMVWNRLDYGEGAELWRWDSKKGWQYTGYTVSKLGKVYRVEGPEGLEPGTYTKRGEAQAEAERLAKEEGL